MDIHIQCTPSSSSSSSSLHPKNHIHPKTIPPSSWTRTNHQKSSTIRFKFSISSSSYGCGCQWQRERKPLLTKKIYAKKAEEGVIEVTKKKGSIGGAVALIIGTSIGSGILALPKKASPAGLLPSSTALILCWGFLLIEALLLVEINVALRLKMKKKEDSEELEVISLRTMAQETLGEWGGTLATVTYVFLGYTSMVAYSSKSGEILFHLINLPESISGFFFTVVFAVLISVGGTRATDRVNQLLTASMIGLLLAIEALAFVFGGWSGVEGSSDWGKVPATIPVIIFSLVYHDLAPVLCAYLGGDLARIRISVFLGSIVPLLALLVWDAVAIGLSAQADQGVDPVELLMRVSWSGASFMVEAFSLLAVGTSLIGTLLGFFEFFKEQLNNFSQNSPPAQISEKPGEPFVMNKWWGRNQISFTAMAMAVAPALVVSTTVQDAFSAATDIAGGYCMTMLYGVLPPAMAWAMQEKDGDQKAFSGARPALLGVGLFACGIVLEQILQDILAFQYSWQQ